MSQEILDIEKRIFSTFAEVASTIGYSPLHGHIIGVLLVRGKPLSQQELARETGYSTSMISLSLDLLEVLGIIKKIKKSGDRKLYIELGADLLESLKSAILVKLDKSIRNSLNEFSEGKKRLENLKGPEKERALKTIQVLEKHVSRLKTYVNILSKTRLP